MTLHFNEFDEPAALEDEALSGCSIHKRIEAACTEPGCPNGPAPERGRIQAEDCIRPGEPPAAARPLWQRSLADLPRPAGIYQTQPKDRCVM